MSGPSRPLRLLLVEDSENDAILLITELRRGGYDPVYQRVDTPGGMKAALKEADDRGEPWEIVISDYYMPCFRAPAALRLLRSLGYDIPFIVVSGKVGEDLAVELMRAGAHDYITKENMARLNAAVERELREAEVRRERGKTEKALERSEDRFRRLVEQAADTMFVHDLDGRFVDVNRQACESLGYAREELLEMSVPEVEVYYEPGALERVWNEVSSGSPRTLEGRHRRKDGSTFPVEVRVGVFENEEKPLLVATVRDITGRKEAEKQLQEAETRFRTLVEQIPAITYVEAVDYEERTTTLLYVSPQIESLFGYSAEEWMADPGLFPRLLHPEDRERVLNEDARTDETGEPFRVEYRQFTRDGRVVWVQDEAALVRDAEGRPLFWQGVVFDITERKRAEEELRVSEERYRTLFETMTQGIVYQNAEGSITSANPAAERILGLTLDQMQGRTSMDPRWRTIREDGSELPGEEHPTMLALKTGTRLENVVIGVYVPTEATHRWITINAIPQFRPGEEKPYQVYAIFEDITERKRAEEELARLASYPTLNPNPIVETSIAGEPTYLNPAAEERFPDLRGLKKDHPMLADLESVEAGIVATGGRTFNREVRVGGSFYLQIISRLPESGLLRIYAVDITEQRRVEEALRQSETLYRTVVEQAAENIFLVDVASKRILECNDAFYSSLGYESEDMPNLTLYDLVAGDRESIDENVRRILEHGRYHVGERQYRRKDGTLVDVEVSVSTVSVDNQPVMCVVAHDITGRKRAEEALEEAREAERNRIARDLHDDILQDIVYALQETQIMRAIADDGPEAELESVAAALRRSVEGLRSAIFELRLESTLKQSFVDLLKQLIDLNLRMSRRKYRIDLFVGNGFPQEIPGRPGREIVRIVQEALNNVRRHAEPENVWVRLGYEDGKVRVEIADDGKGFVPGTFTGGVGQHSMRQRSQELGGELHVESAPGEGTRVVFEMPYPPTDDA